MTRVDTLTCKQASRLISMGLDRELTPSVRASLHQHLDECLACVRFERQMQLLRRALRNLGEGEPDALAALPATSVAGGSATDSTAATPVTKPPHHED
jgi:anti-sigma factor RsiW